MSAVAAVDWNPYDYSFHEDPYPTYEQLREHAPVFHNEQHGLWALSRYADVMDGLRDPKRLSSAHGVSLDAAARGPHAHHFMSFLALDDPRHQRMRSLVSRGFTPRRVQDLAPRILELTHRYLDPALDDGEFDLIADFAGLLPMDVISELMGVPEADRAEVRRLADLVVHREPGVFDLPTAALESGVALMQYYIALVADKRRRPAEDLTSALLEAEIDGDRLAEEEIVAFLMLMVIAGNETTTKLLGNALYWAWRHDVRATAFANVDGWIAETLRYDSSTQMLARTATEDLTYHGRTIPAGDYVVLLLGSANRDPRAFDDPNRYDVGRTVDKRIATFGNGGHFCLGAHLAQLEAKIVLDHLVTRVDTYEVDEAAAQRVHSTNVRGFKHLPLAVTLR